MHWTEIPDFPARFYLLPAAETAYPFYRSYFHFTVHVLKTFSQALFCFVWRCEEAFRLIQILNKPIRSAASSPDVEASAKYATVLEHSECLRIGCLFIRESMEAIPPSFFCHFSGGFYFSLSLQVPFLYPFRVIFPQIACLLYFGANTMW